MRLHSYMTKLYSFYYYINNISHINILIKIIIKYWLLKLFYINRVKANLFTFRNMKTKNFFILFELFYFIIKIINNKKIQIQRFLCFFTFLFIFTRMAKILNFWKYLFRFRKQILKLNIFFWKRIILFLLIN